MKTNVLSDFIFWSFLITGIAVMTRPNSQGPKLVNNLTSGYSNIVKATAG